MAISTINISSAVTAATAVDSTVHAPATDDGTATGTAAIVALAANAIVVVIDVAVASAATAVVGTAAERAAATAAIAAIAAVAVAAVAAAASSAAAIEHAAAAAVAAAAAAGAVAATLRATVGSNRHSDGDRRTNRIARRRHRRRPAVVAAANILSFAGAPRLATSADTAALTQCIPYRGLLRAAPAPQEPSFHPSTEVASRPALIHLAPQPPSDGRHDHKPARARLPIPLL